MIVDVGITDGDDPNEYRVNGAVTGPLSKGTYSTIMSRRAQPKRAIAIGFSKCHECGCH
jgi:hypothetical protein